MKDNAAPQFVRLVFIGFGSVNQALAHLLLEKREVLAQKIWCRFHCRRRSRQPRGHCAGKWFGND